MPLFPRPEGGAFAGSIPGVAQLLSVIGWLTVTVGLAGGAPWMLGLGLAGAVVGTLAPRAFALTLVLECALLAAAVAVWPPAAEWVWTGAAVLGAARLLLGWHRRRAVE